MSRRSRVPVAPPNQWTADTDRELQAGRRLIVPGLLEPPKPASPSKGIVGLIHDPDTGTWALDAKSDDLIVKPRTGQISYVGEEDRVLFAVAMVTIASAIMIVWVSQARIVGMASGIWILRKVCQPVAPKA